MFFALGIAWSFLSLAASNTKTDSKDPAPTQSGDKEEQESVNQLNSQQRMEQRNNNSSIILESNKATESEGEDYDEYRNTRERKAHKGPRGLD